MAVYSYSVGEIGRQHVKVPLVAAISPYFDLTHPSTHAWMWKTDEFVCCNWLNVLTPTLVTSLFNLCLPQDTVPTVVQDAPLMGKFKLKGKGEKQKVKAAKQHISMDPPDLMNGEDGECLALPDPVPLSRSLLHALQRALRYFLD